jgi:hypothetical protein
MKADGILETFAEPFEFATVTFVIPFHPSAWKNPNPKGRGLLELRIGVFQIGRNIPISVNTEKIYNRRFAWGPRYISENIS